MAFMILPSGEKSPPVWTKASVHLVFDVKMEFTRKSRWVKDGRHNPYPTIRKLLCCGVTREYYNINDLCFIDVI